MNFCYGMGHELLVVSDVSISGMVWDMNCNVGFEPLSYGWVWGINFYY